MNIRRTGWDLGTLPTGFSHSKALTTLITLCSSCLWSYCCGYRRRGPSGASKYYYGIFQPAHPCLLSSHNTRTNFPTCPVHEVRLGCLTFLGKPNQPRTSPSGSGDCGNLGSREAVGSSPHPLSVQHKGHSLANFFSYWPRSRMPGRDQGFLEISTSMTCLLKWLHLLGSKRTIFSFLDHIIVKYVLRKALTSVLSMFC